MLKSLIFMFFMTIVILGCNSSSIDDVSRTSSHADRLSQLIQLDEIIVRDEIPNFLPYHSVETEFKFQGQNVYEYHHDNNNNSRIIYTVSDISRTIEWCIDPTGYGNSPFDSLYNLSEYFIIENNGPTYYYSKTETFMYSHEDYELDSLMYPMMYQFFKAR